jgi:hypothetical protein
MAFSHIPFHKKMNSSFKLAKSEYLNEKPDVLSNPLARWTAIPKLCSVCRPISLMRFV